MLGLVLLHAPGPVDQGQLVGVDVQVRHDRARLGIGRRSGEELPLDEVALRAGGRQLCVLSEDDAEGVATRGSVERADYLYLLDDKHRLVRLDAATNDTKPDLVPGALGEGDAQLKSVGVSRDEDMAAGVGLDGKNLYVGALVAGGPLGDPELTSAGKTADERLSGEDLRRIWPILVPADRAAGFLLLEPDDAESFFTAPSRAHRHSPNSAPDRRCPNGAP